MKETDPRYLRPAPLPQSESHVPVREALRAWIKVAAYSFGGPAGQIAVMHRILVEERKWISENRFLHALNYCMLLPGPEAQQLATYIGWLLHGVKGGLTAGLLFILPGFASIMLLSILYAGFQDTTFVQALFYGLKPAVMAVVVQAVFQIGGRALKNAVMIGLAALAFAAIFFFNVPFPIIVIAAGLVGYVGGILREDIFHVIKARAPGTENKSFLADQIVDQRRPSTSRTLRTALVWLVIWWAPMAALVALLGGTHVFVQEGLFFSKAAVVTFGGAYAVLAYIAQQAVENYGWLQPGEMLDGLGMAETTPGPLIQVVQFVGFMGAYRNPGILDPMIAGMLGAIVTTWVTFAPCFLWIFAGAPYIEYLRGRKSLTTALSAITAAVVGVILNLAVWFGLHTLFHEVEEVFYGPLRLYVPEWATLDMFSLLIAVAAFVSLFRYKAGMIKTLLAAAGAGVVIFYLT